MKAFTFSLLTLIACSLISNLSLATANSDCSNVTSDDAKAAILSKMKYENPPARAAEYAANVQKQRLQVLTALGNPTMSMVSEEFGPGFIYVTIGFEHGSISGVVACSANLGLSVINGSFSSPTTGQLGKI